MSQVKAVIDNDYWWDLGLSAKRAALWKDMQGMYAMRDDGTSWSRGQMHWRRSDGTSLKRDGEKDLVPVMHDPGTLGCLLALVRFVGGDDYIHVICRPDDVYIAVGGDGSELAYSYNTEGEALITLLVALGGLKVDD